MLCKNHFPITLSKAEIHAHIICQVGDMVVSQITPTLLLHNPLHLFTLLEPSLDTLHTFEQGKC